MAEAIQLPDQGDTMRRITLRTVICGAALAILAVSAHAQETRPDVVNVNTASSVQLQLLYRVGPVMSERIEAGRPYADMEALDAVKGIGPAFVETNGRYIVFEGETTLSTKVARADSTE